MTEGLIGRPRGWRRAFLTALSFVALASIIVAIPAVLIALGGSPLSHLDFGHSLRTLSSHGSQATGSPVFVTRWLARGPLVVAWILWLWMTVCIVLEFRSRMTGRSSVRLPASRTMQSLATCLVGTTMAFVVAGRIPAGQGVTPESSPGAIEVSSPSTGQPLLPIRIIDDWVDSRSVSRDHGDPVSAVFSTPAPLAPASLFPQTEDPEERDSASPIEGQRRESTNAIGTAQAVTEITGTAETCETGGPAGGDRDRQESSSAPRSASARTHHVKPRETLWSVASDRLGSAKRWRDLAALNYGVPQADGGTLTTDHWIREGWWLELPQGPGRHVANGRTRSPFSNSVSPDAMGPTDQLAS